MSPTSEYSRALVSRPLGGLNDTFCQIHKALAFAEHTGRHLFLDTTESGLLTPFGDFFEFVGSTPPITLGFPESEMKRWDRMSASPSVLEGHVSEFFGRSFQERFSMVGDSATRAVRLPPDDVDSELVIHHQRGGGRKSRLLLSRIRLTSGVAQEIQQMVSDLPKQYAAMHIRATDYTTDHLSVLRRLRRAEKKLPVLVCSDNPRVVDDAKEILGDSRVLHFPQMNGVPAGIPLHDVSNYDTVEQRRQATAELLRDVYAMSGSETFYYAPIEQRGKFGQVTFSGLTMLIRYLHQNPEIRQQFLVSEQKLSDFSSPDTVLLTNLWTKIRLRWERKAVKSRRSTR